MMRRCIGLFGSLACALVALSPETPAQSAAGSVGALGAQNSIGSPTAMTRETALQHTLVTTPGRGLEIVEHTAPLSVTPSSIGLNAFGGLWTYPDGGEGWVGRAVTIGRAGTEVFTEFDSAADRVTLLSGFDVSPVVPVWGSVVPTASTNVRVHGSDATGLFVSCRQIPVSLNGPRNIVVSAYDSSSSTARWSWTFPSTTYGGSRAMVSQDGRRVVAVMLQPTTGTLHVAVFDGGSAVPTRYFTHFAGLQLQAVTLSEDGNALYAATTTGGFLFNMDTGSLIQQFVLLQSFAGQDISGDGSILAYGYFNGVDIWERQPAGNYARTWQGYWPGSIVCQQLDISEDGSTLVMGFGYFDQNLRVRIEAIDLRTKATTMVHEAQGGGSHQNVVSKVACSADGQRFAVGLWGDEADLVPELSIYRRGQNLPIASYNYGGSVYDLAISRSGDRVVIGRKAVHANLLSGGGSIDLYSTEDEDFFASGTPSIGRKVDFELWGAPNSPARLLVAPNPSTNLFPIGQMGVLYLKRNELSIRPMSATDSSGFARGDFQLPLDPALIGTTFWFQGLTTVPRRFTQDFVQITILP